MPTTYLGRDDNGNPLYHVRKADGLSRDNMVSGIQDDTLFHSSLSYVLISDVITVARSMDLTSSAYRMQKFLIPSSVTSAISNGYCILMYATLSDGTRINMDLGLKMTAMNIYPNHPTGGASYSTVGIADSSTLGFRAFPSDVTTLAQAFTPFHTEVWSTPGGLSPTYRTIPTQTYTPTTYQSGLTADSFCLVHRSGLVGTYSTINIASVTFLITNVSISSGTLTVPNIVATSSDIKISKDGLVIAGSNVLAGKSLLSLSSRDVGVGDQSSGHLVSPQKVDYASGISMGIPYGTQVTSHLGVYYNYLATHGIRATCTNPVVLSVGSSVDKKELFFASRGRSTNGIDSYPSSVKIDAFTHSNIGTSNGCEFSKDSLIVNGVQLFDSNNSSMCITHDSGFISIPAVAYTQMPYSDSVTVVGSFTVAKPNQLLAILFNCSHYACTGSYQTRLEQGQETSVHDKYGSLDGYLNINSLTLKNNYYLDLVTLSVGDMVSIYTAAIGNHTYDYDSNLSSYTGTSAAFTCSYYLYRVSTTSVQIIRKINYQMVNYSAWSTDVRGWFSIPPFRFNYMQMTTSSVGG